MYNHLAIIRWLKSHIPFWLRIFLIRIYMLYENARYIYFHTHKEDFGDGKKIFILLSTDYSNLGDHAMTYAQIKFLSERFPEHRIIEVLVGDTMKCLRSIKESLRPGDVVTLKGGGNIGVQYFREELIRRKIVKYLVGVKMVMFPQTVYFPDTAFGKREFKKSMQTYNSNSHFFCFFRDRVSFELVSPYLDRAFLTPDTVFSLGKIDTGSIERGYALTCLRSDVEGIYSDEDKQLVFDVLRRNYGELVCTDTIREYKIEKQDREKELVAIWKQIAAAKVLVTDRLHGMIFAALLGTPCIVLHTYNYKLDAQYQWIKDFGYIKSCELDGVSLQRCIDELRDTSVQRIPTDAFSRYFEKIYEVIEQGA